LRIDSGRVNTFLYHVRGNKEIGAGRAAIGANRGIAQPCALLVVGDEGELRLKFGHP